MTSGIQKTGVDKPAATNPRGGYYADDGPGDNPPPNLAQIPDAVPKIEPFLTGPNRPYTVFGVEYRPDIRDLAFKQRGIASWYGRKFHGQKTSSGELYDMYAMSAAHPTLPIPSYARVTSLASGAQVIVRVNDRGPFLHGRVMDLSYAAAYKLGFAQRGSGEVELERITLAEIRQGTDAALLASRPTAPAFNHPAPTISKSANIFIQLAAFATLENAENFRAQVYRQLDWLNDPIALVNSKDATGNSLVRLHLGPYPDRMNAQTIAEKIRDGLNLKVVLIEQNE